MGWSGRGAGDCVIDLDQEKPPNRGEHLEPAAIFHDKVAFRYEDETSTKKQKARRSLDWLFNETSYSPIYAAAMWSPDLAAECEIACRTTGVRNITLVKRISPSIARRKNGKPAA